MTLLQQLEQIAARLRPKIDDALRHEVADAVVEAEVQAIEENVYGVYSPKMYDRRGDMGGFADPHNIEATVSNGKLKVRNVTEPNPGGTLDNARVTTGKHLDQLIAYGHGSGGFYDFPKGGASFMAPRPFVEKTVDDLRRRNAHVEALKDGLKRLGIKTK